MLHRPLRYLLIGLGFLSVGLAVIGIFLPILPTTPFLLLAAFLFGRSSPRFYAWLHSNRWFGAYLTNYRAGRGLPLREKVVTVCALWVAVLLSIALALTNWWARGSLLVIGTAVTVHLLRIPTYRTPPQGAAAADVIQSDLPG
jgi:uncharacterized membrane protein YbaN (DUF454 family)